MTVEILCWQWRRSWCSLFDY